MKLKVFNSDGSEQSESDFDGIPVFEDARGVQALKEVVVAQAANARQGSANTKTRGEVRGGGKKPWRQKGTGRARHGSIRSPIWVGGGIVFGPKPRDYSKKINKKVRLLAYQRALFERAQDGSLLVLDSIEVSPVKSKTAAAVLNAMVAKGRTLLVDTEFAESAVLAFRNLEDVYLGEASHVSVSHLADFANIVVTRRALDLLIARAQGGSK